MKIIFSILISFFSLVNIHAQNSNAHKLYESKFIQANGVKLHYLDFGGEGLPIIFLQSFHGDAFEWVDYDFKGFAPKFTTTNRVYAVTRRGWGKSDKPKWGYDVATNGEDAIGFMDALGIEKAILVGRIPANQDMIYIAEHHAEQVAGLVFIGYPIVSHNSKVSLVQSYEKAMMDFSWDLGEDSEMMRSPRASWRPHFYYDSTAKINIPALLILSELDVEQKPGGRNLHHMERYISYSSSEKFKPWSDASAHAGAYFNTLGEDQQRQEYLKKYFLENDTGPHLRASMNRAFGNNLEVVNEPAMPKTEDDFDKYWLEVLSPFYQRYMNEFLRNVEK